MVKILRGIRNLAAGMFMLGTSIFSSQAQNIASGKLINIPSNTVPDTTRITFENKE